MALNAVPVCACVCLCVPADQAVWSTGSSGAQHVDHEVGTYIVL